MPAPEPTLDRDALEALAWMESGMPDSKVSHGPDAPRLTPGQLAEFEMASYVQEPETVPAGAAKSRAASKA